MADLSWGSVIGGVVGASTVERSVALDHRREYTIYNLSAQDCFASLDDTAVVATTVEAAGKLVLDSTAVSFGRAVKVVPESGVIRFKTASATAQIQIVRGPFVKLAP